MLDLSKNIDFRNETLILAADTSSLDLILGGVRPHRCCERVATN